MRGRIGVRSPVRARVHTMAAAVIGIGAVAAAVVTQPDDPQPPLVSAAAAVASSTATVIPTAIPEPTIAVAAAATPQPTLTGVPTATVIPTAVPTVAATPAPTAVATPQPTVPAGTFSPASLPAGRSSVVLQGVTSFELSRARPAQHLPGHTAIYLDDTFAGEVDLFVPYATADGEPLLRFEDVIAHIETDATFAAMNRELEDHVGGVAAVRFDGFPPELQVGFHTDAQTIGKENAGWILPGNLRLWILDGPTGPIAVTAETLIDDLSRDLEVFALASDILESLMFHG